MRSLPELPHRPRLHALAELEKVIATAEQNRDRCRETLSRLAIGRDARRAQTMLVIAEERVAQLHRSREVLLYGEQGPHIEDEADGA